MKAKITHHCLPAAKGADYDLENIQITAELPFVPAVGTNLKITPNGDYLEIADVFLDLCEGGEGLVIGLREPDEIGARAQTWEEMKAEGWQIEP